MNIFLRTIPVIFLTVVMMSGCAKTHEVAEPQKKEIGQIIMICVDTMRADVLGSYGCERGITPNMDEFASEAVRFENCTSTSSWTLPAVASAVTGFWPGMIAVDNRTEHLRDEETTLAEILLDYGFRTLSVVNNRFVMPETGFSQGIEDTSYVSLAPADEQVDSALAKIGDITNVDFFMYIHLMDPHQPYQPQEPFLSQFRRGNGRFTDGYVWEEDDEIALEGEREQIRGLYDGEVAFVDSQLGRFFDGLKTLGIWDDAVIIIFADHGEEFWEHGGYEHGHSMHNEVTHVPLMMKIPGHDAEVNYERVSLVDLTPTILGLVGIEGNPEMVGIDLFNPGERNPHRRLIIEGVIHASERYAIIKDEWKQILYMNQVAEPEMYDLRTDPAEQKNVLSSERELAYDLSCELLEYATRTSEGFHVRIYNLPDVSDTLTYQLSITGGNGEFNDVVFDYNGELVSENFTENSLSAIVRIGRSYTEKVGYISLDFDIEPEDAEFVISGGVEENPDLEFPWYLGASETPVFSKEISLSMVDERVSMSYPQPWFFESQGAFVWSVPPGIREEMRDELSDEAQEELRSLGYIQ